MEVLMKGRKFAILSPFLLVISCPALAQVINGDFELGSTPWTTSTSSAAWQVSFLAAGGNPTGYAQIHSPFGDSGGQGLIRQQFVCWTGDPGQCEIAFDYKLDIWDASSFTGRVHAIVNGATVYTSPVANNISWTTIQVNMPCAPTLDIALVLEVDPGNNGWRACFDNVRCTPSDDQVAGLQLPGDGNQDGDLDLSDGINLLNLLFLGQGTIPCDGELQEGGNLEMLDANGDSSVDLSDGVLLFGYLFLGGPPHVLGVECVAIHGCRPGPQCMQPVPTGLTILHSDNESFAARYGFPEPIFGEATSPDGTVWTTVHTPRDETGYGEPGMPYVPVYRMLLAVPHGARARITGTPQVARSMQVSLYPAQPLPILGSTEHTPETWEGPEPPPSSVFPEQPFTINDEIYALNASYPRQDCTVQPMGMFRGLQLALVELASAQYNPLTRKLTMFSSMEFEVEFLGGEGHFMTADALTNPFEPVARNYTDTVANKDVVADYVDETIFEFSCIGAELYILTPPELRPEAEVLAQWKRDKGIATSVYQVNDGAGSGPDTAEEIDEFIESRYSSCQVKPSYLLLFGDAEHVPTVYVPRLGHETAIIATDYPYALVGSIINPFFPAIAVGRLPVDKEQAQGVVDKIIAYESNPPTKQSFYTSASLCSQFDCCRDVDTYPEGTDHGWFIGLMEDLRDRLRVEGYTVERIYAETHKAGYSGDDTPRFYRNGVTPLPTALGPGSGFPWDGDTTQILDAMVEGRFLMVHLDHGWTEGWGSPYLYKSHVASVNNGDLLPVVLGFNCSSGFFDHETSPDVSKAAAFVSFSEALVRNPDGGSIGTVAATRSTNSTGNIMIKGFVDAVVPDMDTGFGPSTPKLRLGDALNHAKIYMMHKSGIGNGVRNHLNLYLLLGDPTLEIWTKTPLQLTDIVVDVEIQRDRFIIPYAVEGATITALQHIGEGSFPVGRAVVEDGVAVMALFNEPIAGAPLSLSASKDNAVSVPLQVEGRIFSIRGSGGSRLEKATPRT
jgi:hypothetical protein